MTVMMLIYFCSVFDSGSESLLYHLSELKGMASWKQKYEPLGLDAAGIEGDNFISQQTALNSLYLLDKWHLLIYFFSDAITAVGSFILKANELLQ